MECGRNTPGVYDLSLDPVEESRPLCSAKQSMVGEGKVGGKKSFKRVL